MGMHATRLPHTRGLCLYEQVPAYNHLVQNYFFGAGSGSNLYAMDTDDGSDMYNMSHNLVYACVHKCKRLN